ncbi:STM4015 family protein [Nocardiopsis sp. NPDC006139]|uniref:STM4015 family protein n=1 Tax=Nocardiopsis sp. NPDC006139 TaxID=3154578 RepID=UPI0033B93973
MPIHHHITEFGGLPVVDFPSWEVLRGSEYPVRDDWAPPSPAPALPAAGSVAWRLRTASSPQVWRGDEAGRVRLPHLETVAGYLDRFFAEVAVEEVTALILADLPGHDYDTHMDETVDVLLERTGRLAGLRSLFVGEILPAERSVSWIRKYDIADLVAALPRLRHLTVRGGADGFGIGFGRHEHLEELVVQSGGLDPDLLRRIVGLDLPALRNLELWLGDEDYGGGAAPDDLAPLLSGKAFPRLERLGVRNVRGLDDWVHALADAPVLSGVRELDLSLGTLTDDGAQGIVDRAAAFAHLERLDLHHHFLSEEMCALVADALPGVAVDLSDPREPEDEDEDELFYYCAVSE